MSNNFALSVLDEAAYQQIQNPGVRAALAAIINQLPAYRSQGTAVAAVASVRDVISDILAAQDGHSVGTITASPENCELLLIDPVAVGSL